MKITISILLLFVCFGCKIRENKASSTYRAKSITVNSTGRIADGQQDDDGFTVPDSQVSATTTPTLVTSIWGDKNDGVTKGVASFNADDFNCDSGTVIDYDDYAKDTPVMGYLTTEDWNKFRGMVNQYDTQKVIMLVCDTSHTYIDLIGMDYKIIYKELNTRKSYWQYGYVIGDDYLDADKKPLSKSIIVWQTKELK